MEFISMSEVKDAERIAKAQRMAAGKWLQVDETKITSPKDMMLLHRVRAAVVEGSATFGKRLREPDINRMFNEVRFIWRNEGHIRPEFQ